MELRDYITVLRKGWVLIVVLALVGVAAAAGFSLLKKPVYPRLCPGVSCRRRRRAVRVTWRRATPSRSSAC